ncbi:MAG: hypothetical protein ACREGJ_00925 [Candidatus Saccharimonadales bacterium]
MNRTNSANYRSSSPFALPEHVQGLQPAVVAGEINPPSETLRDQEYRDTAMLALRGIHVVAEQGRHHRYDLGEALVGEVSRHIRSFGSLALRQEGYFTNSDYEPRHSAEYTNVHRPEPQTESPSVQFAKYKIDEIRQAIREAYERDGIAYSA